MSSLSTMTSEYVGRIAVAVWIGRLTDEAAREALGVYAAAYQAQCQTHPVDVQEAILAEYLHRRDGHDFCG